MALTGCAMRNLIIITFTVTFWTLILVSCGSIGDDDDGGDVTEPTPVPSIEPTPEPSNPPCTEVMKPSDGFLWKPESDPNSSRPGVLVILLPSKFVVPFDSLCVERKNGETECGDYSGKSNGERQTWRFTKPGCRYKSNQLVEALEPTQTCRWSIKDSCKRNE